MLFHIRKIIFNGVSNTKTMVMSMTELNEGSSRPITGARGSEWGVDESKSRRTFPKITSIKLGSQSKYIELKHFEVDVINIFLTEHYEISEEENIPIIKKWFGKEGFHLIQTFYKLNKSHAKQ